MKTSIFLLMLGVCTMAAGTAVADRVLTSRAVERSDYYSGIPGTATAAYRSLNDWLQYREASGFTDDTTIRRRAFIVDDESVVGPLYELANTLLANWPGTAPELAIFVKRGSPFNYGGEVTASNEILIEIGTLSQAESYDELAGVLAHEMSHILLGHNITDRYISNVQSLAGQFAELTSWAKGIDATSITVGEDSVDVSVDPKYRSDLIRIKEQQNLANRFYRGVHASLFSRRNEEAADLLAADLLVAAGLSPLGIANSFDQLADAYTFAESMSSTLKDAADQTRGDLEDYIVELNNDAPADLVAGDFNADLGQIREQLEGRFTDTVVRLVESRHPVPDSRRREFIDYIGEEYSLFERNKQPQKDLLSAYRGEPGVSRLLTNNRLAMEALHLALRDPQTRDMEAAVAKLDEAKLAAAMEDPFIGYVAYSVYSVANSGPSAVEAIESIDSFIHVPDKDSAAMAEYLLSSEARSDSDVVVTRIINEKESFFGLVPELYPAKIMLAQQQGRQEVASRAAADCVDDYADQRELYERCRPYAGITAAEEDEGPLGGIEKRLGGFGDRLGGFLDR